ncbi:MAG: hypothetical protein E6K21_13480 [Gammaproteobacteria bacterium]|nr:MAG: hypothetical protein E6K21_13480 [Gammaproteobacteria bacterium]
MAVQAASLEILEKAAVPPAQARAIVQAIEIEIAGAKDTLATKQDILILRHEIVELRHEIEGKLSQSDFHAAMTSSVRHMYGAIMGQFALLLGVAYFFVSHVQR